MIDGEIRVKGALPADEEIYIGMAPSLKLAFGRYQMLRQGSNRFL